MMGTLQSYIVQTSELLPLLKISPIVTPEKHLKRAIRPWRRVHERIG